MEDAISADPVPTHLRDTSYPGARKLGHGEGYKYPHDFPGHTVDQAYRPVRYQGTAYYEPSDQGEEGRVDAASGSDPDAPG
jgi:putative ATPase